jgi:hypothetical protein
MNMCKNYLLAIFLMGVVSSRAAVVGFDLSPAGTDSAAGLSPLNETPPATNSLGSGNEIGTGITFNEDTLTLSLSLGYGSAFGFTDLTGAAIAVHIHGPALTNTPAPVEIDLAGLHVVATNPASGGSIVGSLVLTTNQAAILMSGLNYINIHTTNYPDGEIRAQLVPVNVLPTLVCPTSTNVECAGAGGTLVNLTAQVADEDGDALTLIWTANGVALQTNSIAAGSSTNLAGVAFAGMYQLGTNIVSVSVSDGIDSPVTCTTTVVVVDTTPPTILGASLNNTVLWPPNHKLIPIQVSLVATDLCGTVTSKIKLIGSNQGVLAKGSGNKSPDWKIVGDLSALLRAERTGKDKNGRTYTLTVEAIDDSGNSATTNLTVFVPHDQSGHLTNSPASNPPSNSNAGGNGNSNGNGKDKGKGKNK